MKPVSFHINDGMLQGLSEEKIKALHILKEIFESELFMWEHFPINPPISRLDSNMISLDDLFKKPDYNELSKISRGPDNKLKKLNSDQLREIRETGSFTVPSVDFVGRNHEITLSWLLQRGKNAITQKYRETMAYAIQQIIIEIPNRFIQLSPLSIQNGLKWIWRGIKDIPDLFIGLKSLSPKYNSIEKKIIKKFINFIIHELKETENGIFLTNDGTQLNFNIISHFFTPYTIDRLKKIRNDFLSEWNKIRNQFQINLIQNLKLKGLSNEEIMSRVVDAEINEKNERLLDTIKSDKILEAYCPGLPEFCVRYYRVCLIYVEIQQKMNDKINKKKNKIKENLKKNYPIRSLICPWFEKYTYKEMEIYNKKLNERPSIMSQVISRIENEKGYEDFVFLLKKQEEFSSEKIKWEEFYLKKKVPFRKYSFYPKIWNPKNWKIIAIKSKGPIKYILQKYDIIDIATDYPGWRIKNFFYRTWKWWKNGFYWLIFVNLLYGPLSIKALFGISEFYPNYKLNKYQPKLEIDTDVVVPTYISRLLSIWKNIKKSRADFEKLPDEGILGKSITRIYNIIWNYIIKGILGTTIVGIGFPIVSLINIYITLIIILLAPMWGPLFSLIQYLWCIFIYDFDSTDPYRYHFLPILNSFIKIIIPGISQVFISFLSALCIHPLLAIVITIFAFLRTIIYKFYDFIMFNLVIKYMARIPIRDNFLARRTKGPLLESDWCYKVTTEVALLALELFLEKEELRHYRIITEKKIMEPEKKFRKLHSELFSMFGSMLDPSFKILVEMQKISSEIQKHLNKVLSNHPAYSHLSNVSLNNVRQNSTELIKTIEKGTILVTEFYKTRIFNRMTKEDIDQFWIDLNLVEDDWVGLTHDLLNKVFPISKNGSFTTPLEESDNTFQLTVDHMDLKQFVNRLIDNNLGDDLEKVRVGTMVMSSKYSSPLPNIANILEFLRLPSYVFVKEMCEMMEYRNKKE